MLTAIHPKLPMRNRAITKEYYVNQLGFTAFDNNDFQEYFMIFKDKIELHFFKFADLDPKENYGQIYVRTDNIDELYQSFLSKNVKIHPNGPLQTKPWGQREFSLLDPDNNLITFGQSL